MSENRRGTAAARGGEDGRGADRDGGGARERDSLEVDGRKAAYLCAGDGPAVVLVHGLGLSAGVWRDHIGHLARRGFRVLAPDLPGFGETEGSGVGQRVGDTAAWLERFAAAAGIDRAAWVGHSVAAQVVLRLAATRPDLARAVVLAAPSGVGEPGGRRAAHQLVGLARDAFRERPATVAAVVRRYLSSPIATVGTWLRARHHEPERDAARVRCPALVVLGDRDPVVPEDFAEQLARLMSDGRLARLSGAGHAVAIDPPHRFTDVVADFLVRLQAGGSDGSTRPSDG